MPITSQVKNYPFEILIHYEQIQGAILIDQIGSLDWQSRNAKKIVEIDLQTLHQAINRMKLLIE